MIKIENTQSMSIPGYIGYCTMAYFSYLATSFISNKVLNVFSSTAIQSPPTELKGQPISEKNKKIAESPSIEGSSQLLSRKDKEVANIKNLLSTISSLIPKIEERISTQELTEMDVKEFGLDNLEDLFKLIDEAKLICKINEMGKLSRISEINLKKVTRILTNQESILDGLERFANKAHPKSNNTVTNALTENNVEEGLKKRAQSLKENLSKIVIGQDESVNALCDAIALRMAKLDDPNSPIAKMLFVGPTGVGKTEMAKAVASKFFGNPASILTINAPEYTDESGVVRLIGSSAGFVGYDDGGLLTNFVQKNPYSVILVDEVEKGIPAIMDLFLKIMDEGSIHDAKGKTTDFKNTVIIFTSNAGAAENKIEQAVKKQFRPEFLGRLNKVVKFNPISEELSNKIVDLELEKLQKRANAEGTQITITQKLRNYLYLKVVQNSTGKGAREVKQIIHNSITTPLAKKLLSLETAEKYFLDIEEHNLIGTLEDGKDPCILASLEDHCEDNLVSLKEKALSLRENLSEIVIGQDNAIETISDAICQRMAKLDDPNKPIAKLLFVGPTGVGKTEMAKAVASEFFGNPASILSINAPEYTHETGISRLIGSSAGFVGYGDGGLLTNFVQKNPYSVILVDEVEKGTPAIMDLFLKILDEGSIQDAQGETTDFKNTVIIFTSNAGAAQGNIEQAIKSQFRPEFLGRLNSVVTFNPISKEMCNKIINLELKKLQDRAKTEGRYIEISDEARTLLYTQVHQNSTGKGAREVKNTIATFITKPLSREILLSSPTEKSYILDVVNGKYLVKRQDTLAAC